MSSLRNKSPVCLAFLTNTRNKVLRRGFWTISIKFQLGAVWLLECSVLPWFQSSTSSFWATTTKSKTNRWLQKNSGKQSQVSAAKRQKLVHNFLRFWWFVSFRSFQPLKDGIWRVLRHLMVWINNFYLYGLQTHVSLSFETMIQKNLSIWEVFFRKQIFWAVWLP